VTSSNEGMNHMCVDLSDYNRTKRHFLSGTTRFEPSLVQIGRTVRPVAFPNKPPKKKKKTRPDSGKLAIRPDHPRRRNECREHNRCADVKPYKSSRLTSLYFKPMQNSPVRAVV